MSAQDDDLEGDFERDFERDPLLAELGALERALDNPGPRAWEAVIAGERRVRSSPATRRSPTPTPRRTPMPPVAA